MFQGRRIAQFILLVFILCLGGLPGAFPVLAKLTFDPQETSHEYPLLKALQSKIECTFVRPGERPFRAIFKLPEDVSELAADHIVLLHFSEEEAQEIFRKFLVNSQWAGSLKKRFKEFYRSFSRPVLLRSPDEADIFWFSQSQAIEILKLGADLREIIPSGSTVLFPGRSPIWIGKAFDFLNSITPQRQYKSIYFSFSGKPDDLGFLRGEIDDIFLENVLTPERYQHFKKYLEASGLNFQSSEPIYIVDYVETGRGLFALLKILLRIYRDLGLEVPDISVIDLSHPKIYSYGKSDKKIHLNEENQREFYFDREGRNKITYHSLNLLNTELLQLLVEPKSSRYSRGYYYPPYRWSPEFNFERDRKGGECAHSIETKLIGHWERHLSEFGLGVLSVPHFPRRDLFSWAEVNEELTMILNQNRQDALSSFFNTNFSGFKDHWLVRGFFYMTLGQVMSTPKPLLVLDLRSLSIIKDRRGGLTLSDWIQSLFDRGIRFVIWTDQDLLESRHTLAKLGLLEKLRLAEPDELNSLSTYKQIFYHSKPIGCQTQGNYVVQTFHSNGRASKEMALAPLCLMSREELLTFNQVVLIGRDSSDSIHRSAEVGRELGPFWHFQYQMGTMGDVYAQPFKGVHYLRLRSSE